ncbi:MAG: hypothetical protein AB8B36_13925, partial [Prochlorococcus sp.]
FDGCCIDSRGARKWLLNADRGDPIKPYATDTSFAKVLFRGRRAGPSLGNKPTSWKLHSTL